MAIFYSDYENGNDVTTATPLGWWSVEFTNGSGTEPLTNEIVTGASSSATAKITIIGTLSGGSWGGSDAAGTMYFYGKSATDFESETVNCAEGGSFDIANDFTYCAWKTLTSGATSERIAPGDIIRLAKSLAPTSIGDATWTTLSKTVTLDSAQTANIDMCETIWTENPTGDATVTRYSVSSSAKEGSYCMKIALDSAVQASIMEAYYATGALDLSSYQKLSFWLKANSTFVENNWNISLCSDNAGAVPVDVFKIPASYYYSSYWVPMTLVRERWSIAFTGGTAPEPAIAEVATGGTGGATANVDSITLDSGSWGGSDAAGTMYFYGKSATAFESEQVNFSGGGHMDIGADLTYDPGGNLSSDINSIAINTGSVPKNSSYVYIDNFIACTTDGLNLLSLISKTSTEQGGTEGWYGLQSINGTTVLLDNTTLTKGNEGRGYYTSETSPETVETFKRETIKTTRASRDTRIQSINDSGTLTGGNIEFQGGYDTSSNEQTGETFFDGSIGLGYGIDFSSNKSYVTLNRINAVRYYKGIAFTGNSSLQRNILIDNTFLSNNKYGIMHYTTSRVADVQYKIIVTNAITNNNETGIEYTECNNNCLINNLISNNNLYNGMRFNGSEDNKIMNLSSNNNGYYGISNASHANGNHIYNLSTNDNGTAGIGIDSCALYLRNATINESPKVDEVKTFANPRVFSEQQDGTVGNNWIFTDGGTINSETTDRGSGSGLMWKFIITSSNRSSDYPIILSIAKIAVVTDKLVTVTAYMKKDHATNVVGKLICQGGQLSGVSETSDTKADDTNWENLTITFTPTEAGVIEIEAWAYYAGGNSNVYVENMTITQAS